MGEESTKDGKVMLAITADSIRDLVSLSNELKIQREDIV